MKIMAEEGEHLKQSLEEKAEIVDSQALTWPDLIDLDQKSWGLRSVSTRERALRETEKGIDQGDVLAISTVSRFIGNHPGISAQAKDLLSVSVGLKTVDSLLTDEEKAVTVNCFNNGLRDFVRENLGRNILFAFQEGDTLGDVLGREAEGTSFLIAGILGSKLPYDVEGYHGIGKCGKQRIYARSIVATITPEREVVLGIFTDENLNRSLSNDPGSLTPVVERLTDIRFPQVINAIRSNL